MGTPANDQKPVLQAKYPVYEMEERGKLVIPPNFIAQLTFLHSHVGKEEWSGLLFYDVIKGDPSKPESFELEVKHIYLMDIGSAAYTEYEIDGDIVDFYAEYPEAMDWKMGHVHTHHNMGSYFSGTDMSELNDNVDKHNYYLSLVVAFDGNYTAKVAFLSEMETISKMNFRDDSGKIKNFRKKKLETHMVVINMRIFFGELGGFFANRLSDVKKRVAEQKAKQQQIGYSYGQYSNSSYNNQNRNWDAGTQRQLPPSNGHYQRPIDSKIIPDKMTSWEIDKLTRNVLMFDVDLKVEGNVYKVLHDIARDSDSVEYSLYNEYLMTYTEQVISAFFDNPLDSDEMETVLREIIMSISRYQAHPALAEIVGMIVNTLTLIHDGYSELNEDSDDEDEKNLAERDIANELKRMERELQDDKR